MIFHENCLPADDSHEISCLICFGFFETAAKFEIAVGGPLGVKRAFGIRYNCYKKEG